MGNVLEGKTESEPFRTRRILQASYQDGNAEECRQRGDATCIDWKSLDMEFMRIAIEATCFVLDDRFEGLKNEWDRVI